MVQNILVGQSGGPTAAINASLAGVYEEACRQGAQTVYGMRHGIQGFLSGHIVNLNKCLAAPRAVELLRHTPSSYLGSCRYKLPEPELGNDVFEALFARFAQYGIDAVFYIGGNDSMDTIAKLARYGELRGSPLRFIGIPKTIDNDLVGTDHTPGYGSAAKYIATVMKELICDCSMYKLKSVTIVEIMGRHAGWLTAAASLAAGPDCPGPDMILLPETPFDQGRFLARIEAIQAHKGTVVIAASEGIRDAEGRFLCDLASADGAVDSFGHKAMLSGTCRYLAELVQKHIGCKTRAVELNTVQRCGSHIASATDLNEAWQCGVAAVQAALEQGNTGLMAALARLDGPEYQCAVRFLDIQRIANQEKKVPAAWIDPEGMQVLAPYAAYARPLIRGEVYPQYENGLPLHLPPLK